MEDIEIKDLEKMGYAIVIYPIITLLGTIEGCLRMCKLLHSEGKYHVSNDIPFNFEQLHEFLGLDDFRDLERKFVLNHKYKL